MKIDDKTGTTSDGSLRYAEVLPADTLMYVVMFGTNGDYRKENNIFRCTIS